MKIIIVGGGISGLALYISLRKQVEKSEIEFEVVIYETYDASRRSTHTGNARVPQEGHVRLVSDTTKGGALGLSANGMRALRNWDENLYQAVASRGFPVSHFHIQNSYGWHLGNVGAVDQSTPPLKTTLIRRQILWNCLRDLVPDHVIIRKIVSTVTCGGEKGGPRVSFADGSPDEEADLVVGADGVRSVAKRAVLGDGSESGQYAAVYEGLCDVGGFIPSAAILPDRHSGHVTMTFGSQGSFGYGPCSQSSSPASTEEDVVVGPEAVWWSTYPIEPLPATKGFDQDDIHRQLRARHSNWRDPAIQKLVASASIDNIWPTWTTPELPAWERDGVVLMGDAAHALQPSSGQGASQALEDVDVFSMLLPYYLAKATTSLPEPVEGNVHPTDLVEMPTKPVHAGTSTADAPAMTQTQAIDLASKAYFRLRAPRVKRIRDHAKTRGDMKRKKGFIGEWILYFFIWLFTRLSDNGYSQFVFGYSCQEAVKSFLAREEEGGDDRSD